MNRIAFTLTLCLLLLIGAASQLRRQVPAPAPLSTVQTVTSPAVLQSIRSKDSGCIINGPLPDKLCTPGAAIPGVTSAQVCTPGYSSSVRSVSESTKNAVYAEYGIATHETGQYEVDHYVSLEIGGSNDIANLWPEAASPTPGFHEKDKVENWLHARICDGTLSLEQAQAEEADNWVPLYDAIK